jgi:Spy/CpxP family protein refolding chaperone
MSGALPTPPPQRLRVLLVASLGLNLLLAGFLTTTLARQHAWHHPHGGGGGIEAIFQHAEQDLSASDAAVLHHAFAAHETELAAAHHAYVSAAEAVRAALVAEPFDAQKLRAAMQSAREARQLMAPLIEAVTLDAAPAMSLAGRQTLARNHQH